MNIYSLPIKVEVNKMPNKDGTGPEGKGPKTGRQMGNCEGAKSVSRGLGPCGRGLRRGLGKRFESRPFNN
jgi:hypothetical protein